MKIEDVRVGVELTVYTEVTVAVDKDERDWQEKACTAAAREARDDVIGHDVVHSREEIIET